VNFRESRDPGHDPFSKNVYGFTVCGNTLAKSGLLSSATDSKFGKHKKLSLKYYNVKYKVNIRVELIMQQ